MHNNPKIEELITGGYRLLEDYKKEWTDREGNQLQFIIPAPYEWDCMSIPLIATALTKVLPMHEPLYPMGIHKFATLDHDRLWEHKNRIPKNQWNVKRSGMWVDIEQVVSLKKGMVLSFSGSNKFFCRGLRDVGYSAPTRKLVYRTLTYTPPAIWNFYTGKIPKDARPKKKEINQ